MRVSSCEGGGQHDHIGLIMTNVEYFAVASDVFLPSDNLGPAAKILTRMMTVQIAETTRLHTTV
jgi:hypothetical protein